MINYRLEYSSANIKNLPKKYQKTEINTRANPPRIALSPTFGKSLDTNAPAIQRATPAPSIVDAKEPLIFRFIGAPFITTPQNKNIIHCLNHFWNFLTGNLFTFNDIVCYATPVFVSCVSPTHVTKCRGGSCSFLVISVAIGRCWEGGKTKPHYAPSQQFNFGSDHGCVTSKSPSDCRHLTQNSASVKYNRTVDNGRGAFNVHQVFTSCNASASGPSATHSNNKNFLSFYSFFWCHPRCLFTCTTIQSDGFYGGGF